jgi:predicted tellurium resistance membrane protein TerC
MSWFTDPGIWASLVTLSALEIVLGVDNVVFISLVAMKLPREQRFKARFIGLAGALVMRVGFLASVVWLARLKEPFFYLGSFGLSWHDVIMGAGGVFLLYKATIEIHEMMEGVEHEAGPKGARGFWGTIIQIMVLDLVFSIDSVMTAVGMTQNLPVMIAAIFFAILVMLVAAEGLGHFIEAHPTTKMLALAFLILIGTTLVADAAHHHFDRAYLYAAIAFSAFVEILNVMFHERSEKRRRLAREPGAPVPANETGQSGKPSAESSMASMASSDRPK